MDSVQSASVLSKPMDSELGNGCVVLKQTSQTQLSFRNGKRDSPCNSMQTTGAREVQKALHRNTASAGVHGRNTEKHRAIAEKKQRIQAKKKVA